MAYTFKELQEKWESLNSKSKENDTAIESFVREIIINPASFFSMNDEHQLREKIKSLFLTYHPDKEAQKNGRTTPHVYAGNIFRALFETLKNLEKKQHSPPSFSSDSFDAFNILYQKIHDSTETFDSIKSYFLNNVRHFNQTQLSQLESIALNKGDFNLYFLFSEDYTNNHLIQTLSDPQAINENLRSIFYINFPGKDENSVNQREIQLLTYRNNYTALPLPSKIFFLFLSAEFDSFDKFKHLFDNCVEYSMRELYQLMQTSLLHAAAKSYSFNPDHKECQLKLEFLIEKDRGLINAPDKKGLTPLHLLIQTINYNYQVFDTLYNPGPLSTLLKNGASLNFTCVKKFTSQKEANTPLYWAISNSPIEVLDTISKFWHEPAEADLIFDAMNNVQTFRWLLKKFPENIINIRDQNGNSLLHAAVSKGRKEVVQALLEEYNFKGDIQNKLDQTPLHLIFNSPFYPEVFSILKKHNINLNAKDNAGRTLADVVFIPDAKNNFRTHEIKFLQKQNVINDEFIQMKLASLSDHPDVSALAKELGFNFKPKKRAKSNQITWGLSDNKSDNKKETIPSNVQQTKIFDSFGFRK